MASTSRHSRCSPVSGTQASLYVHDVVQEMIKSGCEPRAECDGAVARNLGKPPPCAGHDRDPCNHSLDYCIRYIATVYSLTIIADKDKNTGDAHGIVV